MISFFLLNQQLKAQVIEWQRSYHPEDNAKALDEDWFYDIKPSHSGTSGPQDGYIAVGYAGSGVVAISPAQTTEIEYEELHTSIRKKGTSHQLLTKLDLNGNVMWYVESSRSEFLSKVIQTTDGNYVAVGTTTIDGLEKYNPSTGDVDGTNTTGSTSPKKKGYMAKYDTNGNLLWEFTYGLLTYNTYTDAEESGAQLWDLVETDDGGLMMVGFATNDEEFNHYVEDGSTYASEKMNHVALFKTDEDGMLEWKNDYGPYSDIDSKGFGIARNGTNYVICGGTRQENVGWEPNLHGIYYYGFSLVYVMSFTGSATAPNPGSAYARERVISVHNTEGEFDVSTDVAFDNAGNIILPAIVEASAGYNDAHGLGKGKIYKLAFSDLSTISSYSLTGLTLCAYDLKAGVCATSDGGFAITTSIKSPYYSDLTSVDIPDPNASGGYYTLANDGTNDAKFWNNDVYVAKFNSSMTKEWERIIDNKTNPDEYGTTWPADVRRAECVYDINQTEDGGFIIGGNSSANYDDEYAIKLGISCTPFADITGHSITGTETITETKNVTGILRVEFGGVLNITNATLSSSDTRISKDRYEIADPSVSVDPTTIIVEPGGRLNVNNSILKANATCGYMWDGIQVLGRPLHTQADPDDQGVVYISNGSSINDARYGVLLGAIDYNSPIAEPPYYDERYDLPYHLPLYNVDFTQGGGIIDAVNSNFTNNYISIYSTSYRYDILSVRLRSCVFTNNAILNDPLLAYPGNERMGIRYFVNLFNTKSAIIRGCTMEGLSTLDDDKRGTAILNNKSGLVLEDYFSGTIIPFTPRAVGTPTGITNMTKGVDAYGMGSLYDKTIIRNCEFKDVIMGITTDCSDFVDIRSNSFEVPTTTLDFNPYAIYHGAGSAANIQNNTIVGDGDIDYGILVRHSTDGFISDVAYNHIDGSDISLQTEGYNQQLNSLCNGFYDMNLGMDINPASAYGRLADQGDGTDPINDKQPLNKFDGGANSHIKSSIDFLYYSYEPNSDHAITTKVIFPTSGDFIPILLGSAKDCGEYTEEEIELKDHFEIYTNDASVSERRTETDYLHALLYEGYDLNALATLDSMKYIGADKILIRTFIQEGDFSNAQNRIDSFAAKNLQDDENTNFLALSQWLLNYLQNGGKLDAIADTAKIELLAFEDTTLPSGSFAKTLSVDAISKLVTRIPEKDDSFQYRRSNVQTIYSGLAQSATNLNIYPNPTQDMVTITYPSMDDKWLNVKIINSIGSLLLDEKLENKGMYQFSTNKLRMNTGTYFIKIVGVKNTYTSIFVKVND